jgi:hypothetical protein
MSKFMEQRLALLQKMAQIDQMEYGTLKAEYRPGANPSHPLGPYYKHQMWRDGKNHVKRVPGRLAEQIRKAVAGRKKFEQLAQEFIELSVQHTRQAQRGHPRKKTRASVSQEPASEIQTLVALARDGWLSRDKWPVAAARGRLEPSAS